MLEVSLDTLKRGRLTAHQFLLLKMIHERRFIEIQEYLDRTDSRKSLLDDLIHLKGVKLILKYDTNDPNDLKWVSIAPDFKMLISDGDFFEELYASFPVKIIRPNGTQDYLRADRSTCRKIYTTIVGSNRSKHQHILKCLQFEVNLRNGDGTLSYMKRMSNWLTSQEWKSVEERIADSSNARTEVNDIGYGTELE